MSKHIIFLLFISILLVGNLFGQEIVGNEALKITVEKLSDGAKITSIKYNDSELMDVSASSTLFTLDISAQFITSFTGWDSVLINNDGSHCEILLSQPKNSKLSDSLNVKVTLDVTGEKSDWDISVNGLLTNSISKIFFPYINFLAPGNDYVLIPKYSGQLFKNPKVSGLSAKLTYPRGWSSTMQFCAYYNDNYGIYLGTHDPTAAVKNFHIKKNNNNGLLYNNEIYAPDRYEPGNDYDLPGKFRFEIFNGDWYDAAQIYKKWASVEADYWPKDTEERLARQNVIGNIAVWGRYYSVQSANTLISSLTKFRNFMGVPLGFHWYNWNHSYFDDNYPIYFPERDGMDYVIKEVKKVGETYFMPYINGRLFEMNLDIYPTLGKPNAARKSSGGVYSSTFMGNKFANMCPTQHPWQDILVDAMDQLTNRIGTDAMYVDQVTAAGPLQCWNKAHGHKLGGGTSWRDGYHEMLTKMHNTGPTDAFIATEGCNDYLADVVDGFLTDGWTTKNMVPAFQAVYSGKVQLLGTKFGTSEYGKASFFAKFTQAFINGIQPGRFYISLTSGKTAEFARQNARMRHKLVDYLAFGTMLKPVPIDRSSIPTITTTWKDYAYDVQVTISALQHSSWKNKQNDKAVLLFGNASSTKTLSFKLNFTGSDYGLNGNLKIQKITETQDGNIVTEENSFSKDMTIRPLEAYALIITPDSVTSANKIEKIVNSYKLEQNYPNPFNPTTIINFTIPKGGKTNLTVYNVLGEKVAELVNKELTKGEYSVEFNGASLASGLYFYKLQSNDFIKVNKMMLLK